MALNKIALKNNIVTLMTDMMQRENVSIEEFAERLSNDLDTYVKGAKIVYTSGLVSPSNGGAVVGTFNGNLS